MSEQSGGECKTYSCSKGHRAYLVEIEIEKGKVRGCCGSVGPIGYLKEGCENCGRWILYWVIKQN